MSIVFYPAIVSRDGDGFIVHFPDIPGLYSDGDTVNDAFVNAEDALNLHLAAAFDEKIDIAPPSQLNEVIGDEEDEEVARSLVRGERPGKAIRVQITLDEGLLGRIDRVSTNRSRFLADAARHALAATA